ncbi:MAG: hypothetical protein ACI901_000427, partial [Octadecabacter sp.]
MRTIVECIRSVVLIDTYFGAQPSSTEADML